MDSGFTCKEYELEKKNHIPGGACMACDIKMSAQEFPTSNRLCADYLLR
jgi:hypothetical protein